MEAKSLHTDTQTYISRLPWPGNVRQLENVCRWLTVMASGQEVLVGDLPAELLTPITNSAEPGQPAMPGCWQQQLQEWVASKLALGEIDILADAMPSSNGSCWRRRWNTPTATNRKRRACLAGVATP